MTARFGTVAAERKDATRVHVGAGQYPWHTHPSACGTSDDKYDTRTQRAWLHVLYAMGWREPLALLGHMERVTERVADAERVTVRVGVRDVVGVADTVAVGVGLMSRQ